jgi:hypothetical protein
LLEEVESVLVEDLGTVAIGTDTEGVTPFAGPSDVNVIGFLSAVDYATSHGVVLPGKVGWYLASPSSKGQERRSGIWGREQ